MQLFARRWPCKSRNVIVTSRAISLPSCTNDSMVLWGCTKVTVPQLVHISWGSAVMGCSCVCCTQPLVSTSICGGTGEGKLQRLEGCMLRKGCALGSCEEGSAGRPLWVSGKGSPRPSLRKTEACPCWGTVCLTQDHNPKLSSHKLP